MVLSYFVQDYIKRPIADDSSVLQRRVNQCCGDVALTDSENLRIGWPESLIVTTQFREVW